MSDPYLSTALRDQPSNSRFANIKVCGCSCPLCRHGPHCHCPVTSPCVTNRLYHLSRRRGLTGLRWVICTQALSRGSKRRCLGRGSSGGLTGLDIREYSSLTWPALDAGSWLVAELGGQPRCPPPPLSSPRGLGSSG